MSVQEWLQEGFDKGYCSDISCETHEADYYTDDEIKEFNSGEDPCIFVVRIKDISMVPQKYIRRDILQPLQ